MRIFIFSFYAVLVLCSAVYLFTSLPKLQTLPKLQQLTKYFLIFQVSCFVFSLLALYYLSGNNFTFPRNPTIALLLILIPFSMLLFSVFLGIEDLLYGIQWLAQKITKRMAPDVPVSAISRSEFLLQAGFWVSTLPFAAGLLSLKQAHQYKIHAIKMSSDKIPAAFRGFKILQISDIHVGSFWNTSAVEKGVEAILAQKPDLIVFTGDLVNNESTEFTPAYKALFSKLTAPYGVYSVLGNHDYSDYKAWDSIQAKAENLQRVKDIQAEMGWELLLNRHVNIEKEGEKISLIGIENWGLHGFAQYGDLAKASQGIDPNTYQILLSHDPSHWRAQVLPEYPQIDLMLAGHTHGFQAGIETPYFRFSPVQFRYPEWAGLYQEKDQFLYVNRGFGYIGFPGRLGILPEITLITL
jgi:predicted MPP superfamily phosphohydrolase